ncbi:hypothetical protein ACMFMG_001053 [Clarireedia jacksonii]
MDCPIPVPPEAGLEVRTPKEIHLHDGLEVIWAANRAEPHGLGVAGDVEAELDGKEMPSRKYQQGKILGLRVAWFWAVVVVIVILLVGGVGGALTGGLAKRRNADQSSGSSQAPMMTKSVTIAVTPTSKNPSTTTSNAVTATQTNTSKEVINSPCQGNATAANGTAMVEVPFRNFQIALKFVMYCNWSLINLTVADEFARTWAPDIETCLQICASVGPLGDNGQELASCYGVLIDRNTTDTATGQQSCVLLSRPYAAGDQGIEDPLTDVALQPLHGDYIPPNSQNASSLHDS